MRSGLPASAGSAPSGPLANLRSILRQGSKLRAGIHGIDVSHWQGRIDWAAVAETTSFVWLRSSTGVDREDLKLHENAQRCEIPARGYYHFASWFNASNRQPELDAIAEAEFFVRTVSAADSYAWDTGRLQPIVDMELDGKGRGGHMQFAAVRAWHRTFADRVRVLTGRPCGLYTGRYFVAGDPRRGTKGFGARVPLKQDEVLWWAQYTRGIEAPTNVPEAVEAVPHVHQYTGRGRVAGVGGDCDLNTWVGDVGSFAMATGYTAVVDRISEMFGLRRLS